MPRSRSKASGRSRIRQTARTPTTAHLGRTTTPFPASTCPWVRWKTTAIRARCGIPLWRHTRIATTTRQTSLHHTPGPYCRTGCTFLDSGATSSSRPTLLARSRSLEKQSTCLGQPDPSIRTWVGRRSVWTNLIVKSYLF